MHKTQQRQELVGMLKKAGYNNPRQAASYDGLNLEEFAAKVFPGLYGNTGSPGFTKVEEITAIENGKTVNADGMVSYEYSQSNGKFRTTPTGIKIARGAFSSLLHLGEIVGHELNHYADHISGCYAGWMNIGGKDYAHNLSEVAAWSWTQSVSPSYINNYMVGSYMNKLK